MSYENSKPPRVAEFILSLFMRSEVEKHRLGDFEEIYQNINENEGTLKAWKWYWGQAILSIPGLIYNQMQWSVTMLKHYFKTAFRFMLKNKMYSFINIGGLALGITIATLIFLYVRYELSYDKFYDKSERIYRVVNSFIPNKNAPEFKLVSTSGIISRLMKETMPEVESMTKLINSPSSIFSLNEKVFSEKFTIISDENIFNVFSIHFVNGNPKNALIKPNTVVISSSAAVKYFRNENPLNKTITLHQDNEQKMDLTITGVIEDIPANSHFHADFIVSLATFPSLIQAEDFGNHQYAAYVVLKEGISITEGTKKLSSLVNDKIFKGEPTTWKFWLQPLTDIHLKSDYEGEFEPNSNITYVYVFSVLIFLIILIASINFMNLSTARYTNRMKEVGIKKIVGSGKFHLFAQFLFESTLYTVLAFLMSIILIIILLPFFRNIIDRQIDFSIISNPVLFFQILCFVIIIGLFSGMHPALFFTSFKQISFFSRMTLSDKKSSSLNARSGLVIVQYTISILVITSTIVIFGQLNYLQQKKLGYNKDQLVVIKNADVLNKNITVFKNTLLKNPDVLGVTNASALPLSKWYNWGGIREVENPIQDVIKIAHFSLCDYDFLKTLKMKMVQGRFLSKEFGDSNSVVINEQTVKNWNLTNPVGKQLSFIGKIFTIIGVVEDFHYESLHSQINNAGMILASKAEKNIAIRNKPESTKEVLQYITDTWKSLTPIGIEYTFLNEDYAALYKTEQRAGTLSLIFSSLAVAISLLGLFGLTAFSIERRTKEIAVRKVVGASISGITYLLSKQFLKLVIIANIIACPIAYYIMNKWLENMYYRIDIKAWMFIVSGMISLTLAFAVVGFQSIKAAKANLVENLKYE